MRGYDLDTAARFRDAMEFADERDYVRHVLDNMAANDFVELIVSERIGHVAEVVNHVGVSLRIGVDADRARHLVPAATYVENFFGLVRIAHL